MQLNQFHLLLLHCTAQREINLQVYLLVLIFWKYFVIFHVFSLAKKEGAKGNICFLESHTALKNECINFYAGFNKQDKKEHIVCCNFVKKSFGAKKKSCWRFTSLKNPERFLAKSVFALSSVCFQLYHFKNFDVCLHLIKEKAYHIKPFWLPSLF